MGDWSISGNVKISSPGYNSEYCIRLQARLGGESRFTNVAYSSDAIVVVGYLKYNLVGNSANGEFSNLCLGHTGYGELTIARTGGKLVKDWTKFRFVTYYNNNIGCAIATYQEWDINNGKWTTKATATFEKVTEPKVGNFYIRLHLSRGHTSAVAYFDNLELYTSKSIYVSKIVSEAIEHVISKS